VKESVNEQKGKEKLKLRSLGSRVTLSASPTFFQGAGAHKGEKHSRTGKGGGQNSHPLQQRTGKKKANKKTKKNFLEKPSDPHEKKARTRKTGKGPPHSMQGGKQQQKFHSRPSRPRRNMGILERNLGPRGFKKAFPG